MRAHIRAKMRHTCVHTGVHVYTHMCTHAYTSKCVATSVHAYARTSVHTYRTHMCTHMRAHMCTHICTQMCTHTCTHTIPLLCGPRQFSPCPNRACARCQQERPQASLPKGPTPLARPPARPVPNARMARLCVDTWLGPACASVHTRWVRACAASRTQVQACECTACICTRVCMHARCRWLPAWMHAVLVYIPATSSFAPGRTRILADRIAF